MKSLKDFIAWVSSRSLDELETCGGSVIRTRLVRDLSRAVAIPYVQLQPAGRVRGQLGSGVGSPRPTPAEWKILGLARLLDAAHRMVKRSTALEARTLDVPLWLGTWVRRPQPALGGQRPLDQLTTREGVAATERILGSIESGSYQ